MLRKHHTMRCCADESCVSYQLSSPLVALYLRSAAHSKQAVDKVQSPDDADQDVAGSAFLPTGMQLMRSRSDLSHLMKRMGSMQFK